MSGQRVNVAQGQGYLYQTQDTPDLRDDRVIPLGSTGRADRLRVRGASPGDRVCVYDDRQSPPRWGCETSVSALSSTRLLKKASELDATGLKEALQQADALHIWVNLIRRGVRARL